MTRDELKIIPYESRFRGDFEQINTAWVTQYFELEPTDIYVHTNPEEAILKTGGKILLAQVDETIVGTVALIRIADNTYELAKMGIVAAYRGRGIGRRLCTAAIGAASELGAKRLILYSNHRLIPALTLYRSMGFKDTPLESSEYQRADVRMELQLSPLEDK